MGYRLSKIYTRTGDKGTTGLGDGSRVDKDDRRIEAIGDADELNSTLGVLLTFPLPQEIRAALVTVQHALFDLGGELSIPGHSLIREEQVRFLEERLDALNENLPPLKDFVLPGGSPAAAVCHVARTVCRRAERRLVTLNRQQPVSEFTLKYLNRLSDLLFVMARSLNMHAGEAESLWQKGGAQNPPL
jgi:cob(I)alamin adenosyltransferase